MHDFFLAKQIISELNKISKDRKIGKAKSVNLEIGEISLTRGNSGEHTEEINLENLKFALKNLAKKSAFQNAKFFIKKTAGNSWKITDIEV